MTIDEAQRDISRAFVGGGPGVMTSGLVWLGTAAVLHARGIGPAFTTLFFGGMFIFPFSMLIARVVFRQKAEAPGNPLGRVALESTVAMIGGLFAAWLFMPLKPEYVLPLAAVAVGTHYAAFRTVYGDRTFWLLGGLITAVGVLAVYRPAVLPDGLVVSVAVIELAFGAYLTLRARRSA